MYYSRFRLFYSLCRSASNLQSRISPHIPKADKWISLVWTTPSGMNLKSCAIPGVCFVRRVDHRSDSILTITGAHDLLVCASLGRVDSFRRRMTKLREAPQTKDSLTASHPRCVKCERVPGSDISRQQSVTPLVVFQSNPPPSIQYLSTAKRTNFQNGDVCARHTGWRT